MSEHALRDLAHPRYKARLSALRRLALDPSAQEGEGLACALLPLLDDPHHAVRREARELAARLDAPALRAAFEARLPDSPPHEREVLRHALERWGGHHDALRAVALAELRAGTRAQRGLAVRRLGKLGEHPDTVAALHALARDQQPLEAMHLLRQWGEAIPEEVLGAMLASDAPGTRGAALDLLTSPLSPELRALAVAVLAAHPPSDHQRRCDLLATLGAWDELLDTLRHAKIELALQAAKALSAHKHPETAPLLVKRRAEVEGVGRWDGLRADLVRALAACGDAPEVPAALRESLHDRDRTVRKIAARALEARGLEAQEHPPTLAWPEPAPDGGLHADLLPALLDDDPDAWSRHADALEAAGDPRHALVRALDGAPIRTWHLPAAASLLVARHGLGPAGDPFTTPEVTWQRGYWHGTFNATRRLDGWWDRLLGHPSARLLRDLHIRATPPDQLLRLLTRHRPPLLCLRWNDDYPHADLDEMLPHLPHVRTLDLWQRARLTALPPRLERLSINTTVCEPMQADLVRALPHARHLTRLEVWGGRDSPWGWLASALAPLKLDSVGLYGSIYDEPTAALVAWPGLATVRALDFGGFWPGEAAWGRLLDALSRRTTPLDRFESTGDVPHHATLERLKTLALRVDVRP